MRRRAVNILLLLLSVPVFSQGIKSAKLDDLEYYIVENNKETRLPEYKDSEEALKLKLLQLDVINNSRKRYKAGPVKLDILASRVANKMCKDAADNEYAGHWNIAGEKPYHRYAFAGGHDHVSENAFGEWASEDYIISSSNISSLMKNGHETFMAERSPDDGHKKNIIEKSHNYVGIGYYLKGKQFRYYEEFIDRYFVYENIPSEVKVGETCTITVKTNGDRFIYFMIIYREKPPTPMSPAQLKRKGSYEDYTNETYLRMPAWDIAPYRSGSVYTIPLTFSEGGLFYIHLFYDSKEIVKPASLNTRGKTPVSGIVIKVNK